MNKSILGLIAVGSLIAGPAMAADLRMPVKAPYAPPPAVTNWTGCYIDGGVGYGFADVRHHVDVPGLGALTSDVDSGAEGWLGRVGAGCDYQIGARIVLGVFGDYDFSNINGTWADPLLLSGAGNNSSAWAVGGRIGYLVTPSLLTYVDGGYTQMHSDAVNLNVAIPLAGSAPLVSPFRLMTSMAGSSAAARNTPSPAFCRSTGCSGGPSIATRSFRVPNFQ